DCSTPIYGTVTAWRQFLIDTAKEAARIGGYEAPFWVTTGSSDPPVVVTPVTPPAGEGESCESSASCDDGLACYAPGNEEATCVRECTATSDCASGLVCENVGPTSICLAPRGGGDDEGGCSLAARPHGS